MIDYCILQRQPQTDPTQLPYLSCSVYHACAGAECATLAANCPGLGSSDRSGVMLSAAFFAPLAMSVTAPSSCASAWLPALRMGAPDQAAVHVQ